MSPNAPGNNGNVADMDSSWVQAGPAMSSEVTGGVGRVGSSGCRLDDGLGVSVGGFCSSRLVPMCVLAGTGGGCLEYTGFPTLLLYRCITHWSVSDNSWEYPGTLCAKVFFCSSVGCVPSAIQVQL